MRRVEHSRGSHRSSKRADRSQPGLRAAQVRAYGIAGEATLTHKRSECTPRPAACRSHSSRCNIPSRRYRDLSHKARLHRQERTRQRPQEPNNVSPRDTERRRRDRWAAHSQHMRRPRVKRQRRNLQRTPRVLRTSKRPRSPHRHLPDHNHRSDRRRTCRRRDKRCLQSPRKTAPVRSLVASDANHIPPSTLSPIQPLPQSAS
jgi:hypothetical protein